MPVANSMITRIVQTTGDLPAMPHVATLLMQEIADPRTTAKEIHQVISTDQAPAAKLLKIANPRSTAALAG